MPQNIKKIFQALKGQIILIEMQNILPRGIIFKQLVQWMIIMESKLT